jgi:hypothetical protein
LFSRPPRYSYGLLRLQRDKSGIFDRFDLKELSRFHSIPVIEFEQANIKPIDKSCYFRIGVLRPEFCDEAYLVSPAYSR